MSLFQTPELGPREAEVLSAIDARLQRHGGRTPSARWEGLLRQVMMARAVRGSNSIEGYHVSVDDALAAGAGEEPLDAGGATWKAVLGYQSAMTYVVQRSEEDALPVSTDLLRSLHFMMIQHDLARLPGRWRRGPVSVVDEERGDVVYRAPDFEIVPDLVDELVHDVNRRSSPSLVVAAMAHLNLAMIHPFRDGNGRMARCLQTLVLARDRITHPAFASIEEYLGRNTRAYYDVLGAVGGGGWHPERDARPWMRFCLTAHYRQAETLVQRRKALQILWDELEHRLERKGLPPRGLAAVAEAAMGLRIRNTTYRNAAAVSFAVATKDLKALADAGLLEGRGEKRGRTYVATPEVLRLGQDYRTPPATEDPFAPDTRS